ncbi:MAG TPA: hypothetical protein VJZ32_03935 [Candidatus Bathyarchaeia archaeon]|nr:hypothetical protein [Candidatus Bathyarchaeia archaeon]
MDHKIKYSDEPPREGPPPDHPGHIEERQENQTTKDVNLFR